MARKWPSRRQAALLLGLIAAGGGSSRVISAITAPCWENFVSTDAVAVDRLQVGPFIQEEWGPLLVELVN